MMVSVGAWFDMNMFREILHTRFSMLSNSAYKITMTDHNFERCLSCNDNKCQGCELPSGRGHISSLISSTRNNFNLCVIWNEEFETQVDIHPSYRESDEQEGT